MIEVNSIGKRFKLKKKSKRDENRDPREQDGHFMAVSDISFSCGEGEILGLLGPNGAGKTTILRILSTAIKPTSGTASVDGFDIVKDALEVRGIIGFLSGATGLYGRLTAREMITYYGRLNGMKAAAIDTRLEELAEILDMNQFLDRRNDSLSAGMKQKVNIARTLIHDPKVIVFDEPTTGLDVSAAEAILTLIRSCKDQGRTVLFSTHHMHEVERLCDSIVLIDEGEVRFKGTVEQMKTQAGASFLDQAFLKLIGKEVIDAA